MIIDAKLPVPLVIERHDAAWWSVHVEDGRGGDFACSSATSLRAALRGALAYIECVVEDASDPLFSELERITDG